MIRTVVTGYGYWGRIITTRLLQHPHFFVSGVHDTSLAARQVAREQNLHTYRTLEDAINAQAPELVCVCTPIGQTPSASAYSSTRFAHVLAAKPGATSVKTAQRMIDAATNRSTSLTVDYTLTAAPKWQAIKELVPRLGEIRRIDCVRTTPPGRSGADVVEDLAVHDFSLIADVMPDAHWWVAAVAGDQDQRDVQLRADDQVAFVQAARRAGEPERVFRVVGSEGALTWDQSRDSLVCTTGSGTVLYGPDAVDAVTARLWMLSRVIRDGAPDNRATFMTVTRLVEDAQIGEAASAA